MTSQRTPGATRTSVTAHLKRHAAEHGQQFSEVQRRFVMSQFLARVFTADPEGWILKGGVSMMVRLPRARHSTDIDLQSASVTDDPAAELEHIVRDNNVDSFRFQVKKRTALADGKGIRITVEARLGPTVFDTFKIDVVHPRRELVGEIERKRVPRLVDSADFPADPEVQLYPIADQIADKICAMYELHRSHPSGRFRDLVDLLLIAHYLPIDLRTVVDALEQERTFRGIAELPTALAAPGPEWVDSWAREAKKSPLSDDHHRLEAALAAAGRCYDRVLTSLPAADRSATWIPTAGGWAD
ncbi:nucleotidyl transferase AbiEii/AbiGii toxin family protein [Nocardia sp. NPDC058666]|uniref:nucleotidyl transferase AbiEii/AbiGii toxin family protein n=1 Tax=unclassified Nocardia TaxID=2637762 RepID=UPI003655361F